MTEQTKRRINRINCNLNKYGLIACKKAAKMNLVDGEGASTIASFFGVHTNTADAMISAYQDFWIGVLGLSHSDLIEHLEEPRVLSRVTIPRKSAA